MALPNMPSYYTTRKNIYEAAIVNRRTKESDFREKWTGAADYFNKENVAAAKKKNWESDSSFQNSMDAFKTAQDKEMKLHNLKKRRSKLGEMLSEEKTKFEAELKGLSSGNYLRLEDMKERSESLRSAREEKRQQVAKDLLYEHWRQNNPDLRKLESNQHKEHVIDTWQDQRDERQQRDEEAREEMSLLDKHLEEERQAAVRREEQRQQDKLDQELQLKAVLQQQMDELKHRERQAARLKQQEAQLLRSQWELEAMENRQKQVEAERTKLEFGKVLLRQHGAALKRKSKQIQQELEEDRKFLELLTEQEEADREVQSARRDKAQADASWMKKVVEEQIRVEKAREAELDLLYQDEAARIWQRRENEWEKERQARERLMNEVLAARQDQIHDKMENIRHLQQESLEIREQLIEDMDRANQLTRRDQQRQAEDRIARKQEIEAQVTARQAQEYEAKRRLEEELAAERRAEEGYDELLRQEAQNLKIKGFEPKEFGRKTAWM